MPGSLKIQSGNNENDVARAPPSRSSRKARIFAALCKQQSKNKPVRLHTSAGRASVASETSGPWQFLHAANENVPISTSPDRRAPGMG
jgi:hypothetical protein